MIDATDTSGGLSLQKQALIALDEMQAKLDAVQQAASEPIAIIGIGCRFPGGANDPDSYWKLLVDEVDAVREIPADRWDVDAYYDPDPDAPGKMYTRRGGFLDDVDKFDTHFFGISPREVVSMDPQQRLLLEVGWEALEHAGVPPHTLAGTKTGVFVGVMENDYSKIHLRDHGSDDLDAYYVTGNHFSFTAGRLSYVLGVHGPSVALDTACSSSLVAIHLACQSLRSGESSMALAGGVNLMLSPELTITMSKFKALSEDGRCKTFDEAADGFGQGEGCGIIVLKRLSDARADGDNIVALIRGSAVNHDGPSGGLTVPSGPAQQAVVSEALANAGVEPGQVQYVEAHGTGTPLGDPIEVRALGAVFGEGRSNDDRLMIGSVKTNLGHLDSAAGVAGLIKVALSLQHEEIPAHLHLNNLNPRIDLDEVLVSIPTKRVPWPKSEGPGIGGVSSFGLSGTNAHIVLEAPPIRPISPQLPDRPLHILTLSAKTEVALREHANRFARHLKPLAAEATGDVCFSANTGRSHLEHRLAVVAETPAGISEQLSQYAAGSDSGVILGQADATAPKVAFLFTGQGAQYVGMGRRLYETQPTFRTAIDRCDEILRSRLEESLLSVLFSDERSDPALNQTMYTQPALFAVEYALAELWRSWGVEPDIVMGHSVGEYAAACVAGVFSLEDGAALIAERGRLMQSLPKNGTMAAVFATIEQVDSEVARHADSVSIAAVNGPENVVISGDRTAVELVLDRLRSQDIRVQELNVSHAFHSPLMDPILDSFEEAARHVEFRAPSIPLLSNLTGKQLAPGDILDAEYWRNHIRRPVQFSKSVRHLHERGNTVFVELGPNPTLLGMARRCLPTTADALWLPSLREGRDDWESMLDALGTLHVNGCGVDWAAFDSDLAQIRNRINLPTYPFQRQRYWLDKTPKAVGFSPMGGTSGDVHPLLGRRLRSPLQDIQFETHLSSTAPEFLADHKIHGTVVVPGTVFVEMALAGAEVALEAGTFQLDDFTIKEALALPDEGQVVTVQTILTPDGAGGHTFQVVSQTENDWRQHATGTVRPSASGGDLPKESSLPALRARCTEQLDAAGLYDRLRLVGLEYGPAFQGISNLWRNHDAVVGEIELSETLLRDGATYRAHPALLDAALQLVLATSHASTDETSQAVYLPVGIDRIVVHESLPDRIWGHVHVLPADTAAPESFIADVNVFSEAGLLIAEVNGLQMRKASQAALHRLSRPKLDDWLYETVWGPSELDLATTPTRGTEHGSWLIFGDKGGLGATLADRLTNLGDVCTLVMPADCTEGVPAGTRLVDPSRPDDFNGLFIDVAKPGLAIQGIIYLWGINESGAEPAAAQVCTGALHVLQALEQMEGTESPDLWLVTRGAQSVGRDPGLPAVAQAPLWGLGSVISSEHPDLRCVRIDLDPWPEGDETDALFNEIRSDHQETMLAYRNGERHNARLERSRFAGPDSRDRLTVPPDGLFRLEVGAPGLLDGLVLRPMARVEPGAGEVEIRVLATGLNFKDVLKTLGRYPIANSPLGDECAGIITALGPGVEELNVGDRVAAMAYGSFCSHVTTPADLVVALPENASFAQAATLPIAYLTAYYTLHRLANMSKGTRVLIHSATGGVGMMAVQLALRAGAEIFATAGSPRKRALLRSMGVHHVMDSRTLGFAEEVITITGGSGVHLVLNSLADEYIPKSLSVLAQGGCFLEIGRTGVWSQRQVSELRPDVSYHPFYLGDVAEEHPDMIRGMLVELMRDIEAGTIDPRDHHSFPIEEAIGAFRFMSQSRHIGKIVITQEDGGDSHTNGIVRGDGTYLITGGLGGLGLEVAEWLAAQGAAHLVLVGRSAPKEDAIATVRRLQDSGVEVVVAQADVSDTHQIATLLEDIGEAMPPLRGVMHAAAVLDDGVLTRQTPDRFEKVFAPKVAGAWNLHSLTQNSPLDFFVLFSSWAAVVGLPGQGNYVAANAYLDALAHHRRAQGLPALSVNWGAWASVGMAAAMDSRDQSRLADMGLKAFMPEHGLAALRALLDAPQPQVAVFAIDWSKYFDFFPTARELPLLASVALEARAHANTEHTVDATQQAILHADPAMRRQLVESSLLEIAARVLRLPVATIDTHRALVDLGLDSLMSTELFAQIERTFGKRLPLATLISAPTVHALSNLIGEEEQASSWESLVQIQPGGGTPLFLFHAEAGNVLLYRDLARHLGENQPVYGLQAQGLNGGETGDLRIEDMAAHYIQEIRTVQQHGPYLIGGWCLGGTIAFEVAQQLRSQDEQVATVVMIQASNHAYTRLTQRRGPSRRLIDRIEYEGFELSRLPVGEKLSYIGAKSRKVARKFSNRRSPRPYLAGSASDPDNANAYLLDALSEAHKRAFWRYQPQPYQGRVILVRASKQPRGIPSDDTMGWGPLLDDAPTVVSIDSYHLTIMKEPHVGALAKALVPLLDAASLETS